MGGKSKKNKGGGVTLTHHEQDGGNEDGEQPAGASAGTEAGSASVDAPMPPPPPPPSAELDGTAESTMPPPPATTPAVASSTSENADPSEMLREGMVVAGRAETRHIASMAYCDVCTMPYEFCEWNPLFKKCKENFELNHKKHFPKVDGGDELIALMTRLGFEGGDAASKKAQSSKKPADTSTDGGGGSSSGTGGGGGGKKKEKPPPDVVIELNNRNKKKHITVVKGLEHFGVDTAAAAKTFGKKFACGSALKKGSDGQADSIEIQGNYRDELPAVIVDKLKLSLDSILLVVDGKKVETADLEAEAEPESPFNQPEPEPYTRASTLPQVKAADYVADK